jgi:accessory gene regulator protein AgrB
MAKIKPDYNDWKVHKGDYRKPPEHTNTYEKNKEQREKRKRNIKYITIIVLAIALLLVITIYSEGFTYLQGLLGKYLRIY